MDISIHILCLLNLRSLVDNFSPIFKLFIRFACKHVSRIAPPQHSTFGWNQEVSPRKPDRGYWRSSKRTWRSHFSPVPSAPRKNGFTLAKEIALSWLPMSSLNESSPGCSGFRVASIITRTWVQTSSFLGVPLALFDEMAKQASIWRRPPVAKCNNSVPGSHRLSTYTRSAGLAPNSSRAALWRPSKMKDTTWN